MKRKIAILLTICLIVSLFSGCCLKHEWESATCEAPKTCTKCGKTEGEALGHEWQEATCEDPETCLVCGLTQGKALDHSWIAADCENAQRCRVCGHTQGEAKGHEWQEATCMAPKVCDRCGGTEGDIGTHKIEDPYLYARDNDLIYMHGFCEFCQEEAEYLPNWEEEVKQLILGSYDGIGPGMTFVELYIYEDGKAMFNNGTEEIQLTWEPFLGEEGLPSLDNGVVRVYYILIEAMAPMVLTYLQSTENMALLLMIDGYEPIPLFKNQY